MSAVSAEVQRRAWNQQHQILRQRLHDRDFPGALPIFLRQHALIHAAGLENDLHWSFQDEAVRGLSVEQLRIIPPGKPHSIAWLIWHVTRIEDVTLNLLLADTAQVSESGGWHDKLKTAFVDVGNEMSKDEIAQLSAEVDLKALLAYRIAVGKRTRSIVRRLKPDTLWQRPALERVQQIAAVGAVRAVDAPLLAYWGRNLNANLLLMPATRHGFLHLNEAQRLRPKLEQAQN
jgi:hypothetical protein